MENETGSQNKTLMYEFVLEELLEKLKNGSELSDEEMEDIMNYIFFQATDSSLASEQDKKKVGGLRVTFLTMAGNICSKQARFLPYVLKYRKDAASHRHDNFERVLEGLNISSMNTCRENIEVLVKQFDLANQYSESFAEFNGEVEMGIDNGLSSFRGFVGLDSMIKMDEERAKVLSLSKQYKK